MSRRVDIMLSKRLSFLFLGLVFLSLSCAQVVQDCERLQFRCNNMKCIPSNHVCDRDNDCGDYSDEVSCRCQNSPFCYNYASSTCKPDEFRCSSGTCIPSHQKCDGNADCLDSSDETLDCARQPCEYFEFACDNGFCVDAKLKCNMKNDCGDNSDEAICLLNPTNHDEEHSANRTDCGNAYRCKDGTCIAFEQVCDSGKIKHCPDGSDEGGKCNELCTRCQHPSNRKTPNGCICTCPENYRLAGDGITCVDVQECERDPSVCSQLCIEAKGSHSCECFHGFTLGQDKKTCRSQGDPMTIYYTVQNEIRQFVPRRRIRIIHSDTGNLTSLDMDITSRLAYYAIEGDASLHQLVVANKSRKSIANVGTVTLLTLDWITQNVYFLSKDSIDTNLVDKATEEPKTMQNSVQSDNYSRLMMCNFAERHCANFKDLQVDVTAFTIDPINKYLFYATHEYSSSENITETIVNLYRTGLDGQYTRKIAILNATITDMTLDYRHKHLYIIKDTSIDRLDYDGGRVMNMVEASMNIKGLNVFEDHLYFLTQGGLIMHKCQLFGEARRCSSFRLSAESTEMFFIAQITRQTAGINPCLNYNCNHLCVPNDTGAVCMCENGKIVDEQSDCRH